MPQYDLGRSAGNLRSTVADDLADLFNYMPSAGEQGGYSYTSPWTSSGPLVSTLQEIPTKHVSSKYWYRKYRRWSDFWRESTKGALGYGDYDATDPLAQLQQGLLSQYDQNALSGAFNMGTQDFSNLIGARNQGLSAALQQQGARLGIGDAFMGVADVANRARTTMAERSLAAYRPQAYTAQQQLGDQTSQLLTAIAQSEMAGEAAVEGAGRQA